MYSAATPPAASIMEVAPVAAAFARLQATLAALDASTARIKAANLAAAAVQPLRPARTPSPLALLVWAAQQPK